MCDKSSIVQTILIIKTFFKIACYLAPILVIIVSMIHIFKIVMNGKDDEFKEALKVTVKRIIAGLLIAFLPAIINYVCTDLLNTSDISFLACFESASKERVAALKKKEQAEAEAKTKAEEQESEEKLRAAYEEEMKTKEGKRQSFEDWKKEHLRRKKEDEEEPEEGNNGGNQENPTITNNGISYADFSNKINSMNTPTINEIEAAASASGINADYLKIVIGTTANEGYLNDPYLNYGWASAMINNPVTISQMQGWDPSHKGEANYYSQTNIDKGYKSASDAVLKGVYIALTNRNTKIIECNGMYTTTPAKYNKIYTSKAYPSISIYELK